MRHHTAITRVPSVASDGGGVCDSIAGDLQARLCFVLEFLSQVFVPLFSPILNAKFPSQNPPTGGGGGEGEGEGG